MTRSRSISNNLSSILGILFVLLLSGELVAQTYTIRGKVTDSATGDPIPLVNVYFKGTTVGATTDFDGLYQIRTNTLYDSLTASYIGYIAKTKKVVSSSSQLINFQLEEDIINLQEVVFIAEENPAYAIMRVVVDSKKKHDKRSLDAYEYESYTKVEVDVDNINDRFTNGKVMRRITSVVDSIQHIAGEDGKPVMPILFTEAISNFYYKKNPRLRFENMIKTKVSGVGITDGTLTSQFIGSTFQEYNFYQNWMNIVDKEFVSPLADSWKGFYEYYLVDSLDIGGHFCYQIDIQPKRQQDLAFQGTIWITKKEHALKQVDLTVATTANLNFIERIKIQQELIPTEADAWVSGKTRILLDIGEITKKSAGILAKFYVSNKNVVVNQPHPNDFYRLPIKMEETVRDSDEAYWAEMRHDSLSKTEIAVYEMIDTLKTDPFVKLTTNLSKFAANTYHPIGKLEWGPYTSWYANNNIEGFRIGMGARTNLQFSSKWVLEGYAGYGFGDERWKYSGAVKRIIKREPWTTLQVKHSYEIDPIWILNDEISPRNLFYAFSRFGRLSDPFSHTTTLIDFQTQSGTGWNNRILFKHQHFVPEFDFNWLVEPGNPASEVESQITTTEINFETRIGKDELWVINDNERLSMGSIRSPVLTLRYTLGLKDVLGGDFAYHKVEGTLIKNQKMGGFGTSLFKLDAGYIFSQLPYPMLKAHIGNETPFYIGFAYNLMDYYEFTSDRHASFNWRHQFQGMILNRIPLMKKLKWRLTGTANILYGGVRQENLDAVIRVDDGNGNMILPFQTFDTRPYVELGYGVENIFKVFRVDAFHRLTYLDRPGVRKFGIKFSFQVIL